MQFTLMRDAMSVINKPKLTPEEQIKHLIDKGVKFSIMSEEEALSYLTTNSNYFKLTAYRKNFAKHPGGPHVGKYQNLEFAALRDLAIIDMRLRYILMHMALDIEHFAKIGLLRKVESDPNEDGYCIVADFISSLDSKQKKRLKEETSRNKDNLYCGAIVDKYDGCYPIWAFMEIIPFGRLLSLYLYCAKRFSDKALEDQYYLLLAVRQLRNAVAHNICVLNDLSQEAKHRTQYAVLRELGNIKNITRAQHRNKLASARIQQIVTLLYAHREFVNSKGIRESRSKDLHELKSRFFSHKDYYQNNQIITTFEFLEKVIDNWFPIV